MFLSLQYPCVQFHDTLKISFQFQPRLMSIKTCPIISKGSHVLSIKFIKNVPCEVGIRGVKKKKNEQKKYHNIKRLEFPCSQTLLGDGGVYTAEKLGSDQPKKLYGIVSFCKNTGVFLNTIGAYDPVETLEYFFTKIVYVPYNFFLSGPDPVFFVA